MTKPINFKNRIPELSEEHIKQICRFTATDYVEGQWQRLRAYAEFKIWHHEKLKERDGLKQRIKEIERRSKKYPPVQHILNEYLQLKEQLSNLESGEF